MRLFDHNLITVRSNPFSNSRSRAIGDGVFMKDLISQEPSYISSTDQYIAIGIVSKLMEKTRQIEDGISSQHILVLGEYGQGKSFSLKIVQDDLYINYNSAIASYSIGGNAHSILQDDNFFQSKIMEDLENLFQSLDPNIYSTKTTVEQTYQLTSGSGRTFHQFLEAYNQAFADLQIQVYIFIDELDKIVLAPTEDIKIINFLENLKLIADVCDKSISLIIAGTPNCLVKMNNLSIDYAQRFDSVENNFLTLDDTSFYIKQKFKTKLSYVGHYPFDKQVIRKIHSITQGNIRKIEAVCRELWLISAREQQKIALPRMNVFLQQKLSQPILNIFPLINNQAVKFIANIFINEGKISKFVLNSYSNRDKNEILNLVSTSPYFREAGNHYIIDVELITRLSDILLN